MVDISGHAILKIVKGIQKVPGDALSAEIGLDEIDLLDGNGFACDEYDMKLPALKSSAVYADSPLTDGRTLISGTLGNVIETIRLQLTAGTIIQMSAMLSKLGRFKQDCNDFWDTFNQIEPVYLKHQVIGEPGPRYALLYDIDVDLDTPLIPSEAKRTVTLVIEREYGWRGLAPGANPKQWAIENLFSNQAFNNNNAALLTGTDFLHYETNIVNRAEQNAAQTGYNVKNFVDIPAARIPGDLPALLCLSYSSPNVNVTHTTVMVSKTTKRNTGNISRSTSTNQYLIHVFNAADATVGTDTTLAADTGASTGISGLQRRSNTTFVTATLQTRLSWDTNNYTANGFNLSVLRGRYAVFCRARLSAAATTVELQLTVIEATAKNDELTSVVFTDVGSGGVGNTTNWALAYLGQISLPSSDRKTSVSANGLGVGVDIAPISTDLMLQLKASRTAGAGVLYVNDLIFMPIDEGAINLVSTGNISTTSGGGVIYDNTGYLQHGLTGEFAIVSDGGGSGPYTESNGVAVSGPPVYLSPGVDNRLEFLAYIDSTKQSFAVSGFNMVVRASIVPRWSGLRDK